MKLLLLLAHLSICFAGDLFYKDKFVNSKYGSFGATLATTSDKLIIGTYEGKPPAPIFIVQAQWIQAGKLEKIPPPAGCVGFGGKVAANEHYILTVCARSHGMGNDFVYSIVVFSAAHPYRLVAEIPAERRGRIGAAISEDNTIVILTEASTVMMYNYDGHGEWSQEVEINIGKYPFNLFPFRAVAISGNHAVVGITKEQGVGEAYVEVFEKLEGGWKRAQTIKSSEYTLFGTEVAMHKDHLVVAAARGDKEQHAFVYKRDEASGKWLQEGHLTIPLPTTGGFASFGVDVLIDNEHLIAVSTRLKNTVVAKVFKESNGKWAEYANLNVIDPLDDRQGNFAVRFASSEGTTYVVTSRVMRPYEQDPKRGEVYLHVLSDLSKIHDNEGPSQNSSF